MDFLPAPMELLFSLILWNNIINKVRAFFAKFTVKNVLITQIIAAFFGI